MAVIIDYGHLWDELKDYMRKKLIPDYRYIDPLHLLQRMELMEWQRWENARRILTRSRVTRTAEEIKDVPNSGRV